GLLLGHHATYPAQDAPESALAFVPGRHSFASCDSADCRVPPHWTSRVAASHRETSGLCPTWGKELFQRVSEGGEPLDTPPQLGQFVEGRLGPTAPIEYRIHLLHDRPQRL